MTDVWGGGLVIVVAAALWLAYLTPSWLKRREYLATERNAVRLQQTLRILAETSEVPDEVRVEARARVVAEQEKALRASRKHEAARAKADAEADAARSRLEAAEARRRADALIAEAEAGALGPQSGVPDARHGTARPAPGLSHRTAAATRAGALRRRRLRATASVVLLISLIGIAFAVGLGFSAGEWLPVVVAAVVAVSCVATLRRLARPVVSPWQASSPIAVPAVHDLYDHARFDAPAVESRSSTWTPTPLPKPLHLERGTIAAGAMASVDAATMLRRAAALEAMEAKAAEAAVPTPRIRPAAAERAGAAEPIGAAEQAGAASEATSGAFAAASAPASVPAASGGRYARMGIVEDDGSTALDLDAALRRRRVG